MTDFSNLVTLPYVDEDRIGAIGVCGGGGYTIHAALTDHRIKALASITGVNFGRLINQWRSECRIHESKDLR